MGKHDQAHGENDFDLLAMIPDERYAPDRILIAAEADALLDKARHDVPEISEGCNKLREIMLCGPLRRRSKRRRAKKRLRDGKIARLRDCEIARLRDGET